ncbi:MAG: hypothetical protein HN683_04670 [Gammaproteobacteria bacterium]|jgi:hypothetical protein|nr:hypothetical protein [Gammaproteobacteria bacterium]
MNKNNIKHWEENGKLYSEWADRALDDDDRYEPDSICICVEVTLVDYDTREIAEGILYRKMWDAYDAWVLDTRGSL